VLLLLAHLDLVVRSEARVQKLALAVSLFCRDGRRGLPVSSVVRHCRPFLFCYVGRSTRSATSSNSYRSAGFSAGPSVEPSQPSSRKRPYKWPCLPATDTPCSLRPLHRNTCRASVSASARGPEWAGYLLSPISFSDTDSVDCRVFPVGSKPS
jgi:hypothetical protein